MCDTFVSTTLSTALYRYHKICGIPYVRLVSARTKQNPCHLLKFPLPLSIIRFQDNKGQEDGIIVFPEELFLLLRGLRRKGRKEEYSRAYATTPSYSKLPRGD